MPVNPSDSEQEYFLKMELEKLRKAQAERAAKMQEEEKKKTKELHWMKCPKCGSDLEEVEYRKIKVDYCGGCQGSWFDAGEIQQLLTLEDEQHVLGKFLKLLKK
jgi:Pyruvate/2-oxoacid:ferredoxin oxidoreductase delta subunit